MTENNAKIIELAALMSKCDQSESDDDLQLLNQELKQLTPKTAIALVMMAQKLLDGKCYSVSTDDPEDIRRCIAIAHLLGATVEDNQGHFLLDLFPPNITSIRIVPPSPPMQ